MVTDDKIDVKDLCRYIEEQLKEMSGYMSVGTGNITIGETEDKDWMNKWKDFFHPFRNVWGGENQPRGFRTGQFQPNFAKCSVVVRETGEIAAGFA